MFRLSFSVRYFLLFYTRASSFSSSQISDVVIHFIPHKGHQRWMNNTRKVVCWNLSLDWCNIRLHIFLSSTDQVSNRIPLVRCLRGVDVIVRKWVGPHCWAQIAVPLKTIGGQRGSFNRNSDWAGPSWGCRTRRVFMVSTLQPIYIHKKYTFRINHFIFFFIFSF